MDDKTEPADKFPTDGVSFAQYRLVGGKRMRRGYTTGSCAAAAAAAAAECALKGTAEKFVRLTLPGGQTMTLETHRSGRSAGGGNGTDFYVIKDSGDDPDLTNGIRIYASASRVSGNISGTGAEQKKYFTDPGFPGIYLCGGEGVGIVTRSGLEQPVGYAAINRVPRRMIFEAVGRVRSEYIRETGAEAAPSLLIRISAENGREIALKTFNPLLGIEGGISILGTTGIVEPMSERAMIDTIRVQLRQQVSLGVRDLLFVPGHYGERYVREFLGISQTPVTISNYVGEAMDIAVDAGAEAVLLAGDAGKLSKISAGIMNTHSHAADGRREIFTSHAALLGADPETLKEIWKAVTTEEMLVILDRVGLREKVCASVTGEIGIHLKRRAGYMQAEAVLFSKKFGIIGKTEGADALIEKIRNSEFC